MNKKIPKPPKPTVPVNKLNLETLSRREDRILALLREERNRTQKKFPLLYALLGTIGLLCTVGGLNKIIGEIDFLNNNPITLVVVGLTILLATGAAYRKL